LINTLGQRRRDAKEGRDMSLIGLGIVAGIFYHMVKSMPEKEIQHEGYTELIDGRGRSQIWDEKDPGWVSKEEWERKRKK
jgi:hypothetical protein